MSRKSIFLIGLLTIALMNLSGCAAPQNQDAQHPLLKAITDQFAVRRDVELVASAERKGKEIVVSVAVHNLGRKPITSVQSWLSYDPKQLKGVSISTDNTPFTLTAPYENEFDNTNGVARIGRAANKPITDQRIDVARVTFEALTDDLIMLSFYDYQTYLTGHTSVNMLVDNTPFNVLKQPNFPAVVIPKSG